MLTKSKRSKNADLAACVVTINVSRRITLCIAEILSDLECLFEIHAVTDHLCENEVSGSVENTCDLVDLISGKARMQRLDYRNSTANARFKEEINILLLSDSEKLRALSCNKFLVRCNNALASL